MKRSLQKLVNRGKTSLSLLLLGRPLLLPDEGVVKVAAAAVDVVVVTALRRRPSKSSMLRWPTISLPVETVTTMPWPPTVRMVHKQLPAATLPWMMRCSELL